MNKWINILESIDRRIIYVFVAVALSIPIMMDIDLRPAEMATADSFFEAVDKFEIDPGDIVLVASDWGPGTLGENKPQTMLAIEHLFRKRVPFALISVYNQAAPFLDEVPKEVIQRLEREMPDQKWEYGKDWVNLGFQFGNLTMIQNLAKAEDFHTHVISDAYGTPLSSIPVMKNVKTIKDVPVIMEFTGLTNAFNNWLQFFSGPVFLHGCTSVTIPEAFIFYASQQIRGLLEGIAGAARYEYLLYQKYPQRLKDSISFRRNTGLSFAQLVILSFIALGNIGIIARLFKREGDKSHDV